MNLYNLHVEPESLRLFSEANEYVPKLFWDKYRDSSEELRKREKAISKSAYYSYWYARDVLKRPFPAGEAAISNSTKYAYYYALDVLKGPFPAGAAAISRDARFAHYYAQDILKGPFPKDLPCR